MLPQEATMSLNTLEFLLVQALRAIRRNPLVTVAAITNVAVALTILGAFGLLSLNLTHMADLEAQAAVITCELAQGARASDVETALLSDQRVKKTKFLSKTEARQQLADKYKLDINALKLIPNTLPDSILVYVTNPRDIDAVCKAAGAIRGVALARYPQQITSKLLTVAHGVRLAGLVVGALLVLATITVINTTIRLTIYARRREIRIMQLVGATKWFIRLPFLLEGLFHGIIGGVAAAIATIAGYSWVNEYVSQNVQFISLLENAQMMALFAAATIVCGALFGMVGSMTGLRRFLRLV
jgi:cell division transport system permease protein